MSRGDRLRTRGLTLLELLAVLAILSSTMALALGALGRTSSVYHERAARRALHHAWQRTSLLAQQAGGATLLIDEHHLVGKAQRSDDVRVVRETLPRGWRAHWQDGMEIEFDVRGRTSDLHFVLTGPREERGEFLILGVSGQLIGDKGEVASW